jgi:hypothetical protein
MLSLANKAGKAEGVFFVISHLLLNSNPSNFRFLQSRPAAARFRLRSPNLPR